MEYYYEYFYQLLTIEHKILYNIYIYIIIIIFKNF